MHDFVKNIFRYLFYSIAFFIVECNEPMRKLPQQEVIKQIYFASGGCYHCPKMAIEIDTSLNYNFYGSNYTDILGVYHGKISQAFWGTLTTKLLDIDFKNLDTLYKLNADALTTQMIIYYDDKRKSIFGSESSIPPKLMSIYYWLINSYKRADLKPNFETKIQNPVPPPPMPIEYLKVTPPKS
jgi:hypothetical protein